MNKQEAVEILEMQRDSFLVTVGNHVESDYDKWCKAKAKDFQDVIDWIKELEELEE